MISLCRLPMGGQRKKNVFGLACKGNAKGMYRPPQVLMSTLDTLGLEKKNKTKGFHYRSVSHSLTAIVDRDYQSRFTATINFSKIWGGPESTSTMFLHLPKP